MAMEALNLDDNDDDDDDDDDDDNFALQPLPATIWWARILPFLSQQLVPVSPDLAVLGVVSRELDWLLGHDIMH